MLAALHMWSAASIAAIIFSIFSSSAGHLSRAAALLHSAGTTAPALIPGTPP
jgi:hypothetical protein